MKGIAKSLVVLSAVAAAGSVSADMMGDLCPYIGLDFQQSWMTPRTDWKPWLPKSFPGASVYVGAKFHESFGVEVGVGTSGRKNKNWVEVVPGTSAAAATYNGTSKVRRSDVHIDLVGFLPMNDCFDLLGSIGWGWVKPKTNVANVTTSVSNAATALAVDGIRSINIKGKSVFRVGIGASWMVAECFGLRAKVGWETGNFTVRGNQNYQNLSTALGWNNKAYKSTTTLNVGGFFKF